MKFRIGLPVFLRRDIHKNVLPSFNYKQWQHSYSTASNVPCMNVPVLQRVLQFHDRVALADHRGEYTYGQLYLRRYI